MLLKKFILIFSSLFFCFFAQAKGAAELQEAYAAVAEKACPAVVTVHRLKYTGNTFIRIGVGSGFLIAKEGFILTNYHVISECDALAVQLYDKKLFPAKLIGTSKSTDLAVIRIDAKRNLPYLRFADTATVKVGHYAIAIGSPFALSQTFTTGVVSHKGRSLGLHYQEDYIQTDAAINPGNSGGPLLNIKGLVIGVNDCIIGKSNAGLGFAIDGNLAHRVALAIIRANSSGRPFAGFVLADTTGGRGPVVARIIQNSPASSAGFRKDDCILQLDGKNVRTVSDVQTLVLSRYQAGDTIVFTISRKGKIIRQKLKLERIKDK